MFQKVYLYIRGGDGDFETVKNLRTSWMGAFSSFCRKVHPCPGWHGLEGTGMFACRFRGIHQIFSCCYCQAIALPCLRLGSSSPRRVQEGSKVRKACLPLEKRAMCFKDHVYGRVEFDRKYIPVRESSLRQSNPRPCVTFRPPRSLQRLWSQALMFARAALAPLVHVALKTQLRTSPCRLSSPTRAAQVISHPYYQRMRYIAQLGATPYVYYGGAHTRFEHSLGVGHLARRAATHLKRFDGTITEEDITVVTLAGEGCCHQGPKYCSLGIF